MAAPTPDLKSTCAIPVAMSTPVTVGDHVRLVRRSGGAQPRGQAHPGYSRQDVDGDEVDAVERQAVQREGRLVAGDGRAAPVSTGSGPQHEALLGRRRGPELPQNVGVPADTDHLLTAPPAGQSTVVHIDDRRHGAREHPAPGASHRCEPVVHAPIVPIRGGWDARSSTGDGLDGVVDP